MQQISEAYRSELASRTLWQKPRVKLKSPTIKLWWFSSWLFMNDWELKRNIRGQFGFIRNMSRRPLSNKRSPKRMFEAIYIYRRIVRSKLKALKSFHSRLSHHVSKVYESVDAEKTLVNLNLVNSRGKSVVDTEGPDSKENNYVPSNFMRPYLRAGTKRSISSK